MAASRAPRDGRDGKGGVAVKGSGARAGRAVRRLNCAPAYYLGRPAHRWITAMRRTASNHPRQASTGGREETPSLSSGLITSTGAGTARVAPATVPSPRG
jgi:hypothetical protein